MKSKLIRARTIMFSLSALIPAAVLVMPVLFGIIGGGGSGGG